MILRCISIIRAQFTIEINIISVSEKFAWKMIYFRRMASRGDYIILGKLRSFDSFDCRNNKLPLQNLVRRGNEVCMEEKCVSVANGGKIFHKFTRPRFHLSSTTPNCRRSSRQKWEIDISLVTIMAGDDFRFPTLEVGHAFPRFFSSIESATRFPSHARYLKNIINFLIS